MPITFVLQIPGSNTFDGAINGVFRAVWQLAGF
jgi:hypothetical protein